MQYMLMFYENEAEIAAQRDNAERTGPYWDAWNAYMGALYPTGIVVRGDALLPHSAATTVRLEGGNRLVQDGPVAATKEQLAGYVVIEVPDLDAALAWLNRFRRLAIRYEWRADIHQAFVVLGCAPICLNQIRRFS